MISLKSIFGIPLRPPPVKSHNMPGLRANDFLKSEFRTPSWPPLVKSNSMPGLPADEFLKKRIWDTATAAAG
jgi:hypothetical protein